MIRTEFQLSVEDIELLLDLLGPVNTEDSHARKHLRERLQETLHYLRERDHSKTENVA